MVQRPVARTVFLSFSKIPVVLAGHVHFDGGLLLSCGPLNDRTGHQAARLADQILRGVRAADIPVETSDFYLGINLKTARSIGLEIPDDILQQADFIIRQQGETVLK
jgi:putative ABC transport system substrate-binding protein